MFADSAEDSRKIRYAVVGLGWIAQEVILPAFKDARNAALSALVTDNPKKAKKLSKKYEVSQTFGYQQYDELLRSGAVDAVFITLPNSMHKDYTVRAARAGIHVLCEKPMADSVAECEEMIRAAEEGGVKLMIAYRLHFEPANLRAVELIQQGAIGEPRIFHSILSQQVKEGNVRLKRHMGGGPLMDMGVYPINACRYLFRDEPREVVGMGGNSGDTRFSEVHEMASAILRFPGDRLAVFTCSFGAASADTFQVIGTKGDLRLEPAFDYHPKYNVRLKVDNKEQKFTANKVDQFGGEIEYFSECIIKNVEPEPNGYEGLADVRIVEALLQSMRTKQAVELARFEKKERPGEHQKVEKAPIKPQKLVHAEAAAGS